MLVSILCMAASIATSFTPVAGVAVPVTILAQDGYDTDGRTPKPTTPPDAHDVLKRQQIPPLPTVCGYADVGDPRERVLERSHTTKK